MKSPVLHTVWCYVSGEAEGKIWNWLLLGVKATEQTRPTLVQGLIIFFTRTRYQRCGTNGVNLIKRQHEIMARTSSLANGWTIMIDSSGKLTPFSCIPRPTWLVKPGHNCHEYRCGEVTSRLCVVDASSTGAPHFIVGTSSPRAGSRVTSLAYSTPRACVASIFASGVVARGGNLFLPDPTSPA